MESKLHSQGSEEKTMLIGIKWRGQGTRNPCKNNKSYRKRQEDVAEGWVI